MKQWSTEERQAWYADLPRFYGSAAMLITDPDERVLLVKPNYREHWTIPGGILEADEYPHEGCEREIREELGLAVTASTLLVLDWAPASQMRPHAMINFLFDGGTLSDPSVIDLQEDELDGFAFIDPLRAFEYLPANVAPRVQAGLAARQAGHTRYLSRDFATHSQ